MVGWPTYLPTYLRIVRWVQFLQSTYGEHFASDFAGVAAYHIHRSSAFIWSGNDCIQRYSSWTAITLSSRMKLSLSLSVCLTPTHKHNSNTHMYYHNLFRWIYELQWRWRFRGSYWIVCSYFRHVLWFTFFYCSVCSVHVPIGEC